MTIKLVGKDDTTIDGSQVAHYFYREGYVAVASGVCDQIRVKCSGNGYVKVAIYDIAGWRQAKQDQSTAVSAGWNTIMLETPCGIVQGNTYYLAINSSVNCVGYDYVGSGSLEYYKYASYAAFVFPEHWGTGWTSQTSRETIIAGWGLAPETYVETGRTQVILAEQGSTSPVILSEVARLQTLLAGQGQASLATFTEEAKLQAILAIIGEWDEIVTFIDETGKLQIILAVQDSVDKLILPEVGHTIIISAIQGREDLATFLETARTQIVLAAQGSTDSVIFLESLEQIILAAQGSADLAEFSELALEQVILAIQGRTDGLIFPEIGHNQTVLVVHGSVDSAVFLETVLEQAILAVQGRTDDVIFLESLEQVILAIQGRVDSHISDETAKLIPVMVRQGSWNNLIRLSLQQSISGKAKIYPLKTYPIKTHPVFGQKEA